MPEPRLVHLVDDNVSTRQATASLLSEHKYSVLIHPSSESFLYTFTLLPSGTVLLRLGESAAGLAILPRLLARNITWPIVLLLNDGTDRMVVRTLTLRMPDQGWSQTQDDLLQVLQAANRGVADQAQTSRDEAALADLRCLSPRECEILARLGEGKTYKIIARELSISPRTIEVHRANIMRKFRVHRSADLVQIALRAGLAQSLNSETQSVLPASRGPMSAA